MTSCAYHDGVASITVDSGKPRALRWTDHDAWPALSMGAVAIVALGPLFAGVGLPDVPVMWPYHQLGVVFPSCGLTRGVVAIFRGDLVRAWKFNPASFLALALAAVLVVRAAVGVLAGRWLTLQILPRRVHLLVAGLAVVALWAHQQRNAQFILHHLR